MTFFDSTFNFHLVLSLLSALQTGKVCQKNSLSMTFPLPQVGSGVQTLKRSVSYFNSVLPVFTHPLLLCKTRLALNFKGLKYNTVYIEYPDIKQVLSSLGVAPNPTGTAYTLPALRVGDRVPFMESLDHAHYLDKHYPSLPTLLPPETEDTLKRFSQLLERPRAALFKIILSAIPTNVLGPKSAAYFTETRTKRFGCSLEEVSGVEGSKEREALWAELEEALKPVGDMLGEKEGPFFEGHTPTFVDLDFTAILFWAYRAQEASFERIMKMNPKFRALWEGTSEWRSRTGL